jgi:hypothetical protein
MLGGEEGGLLLAAVGGDEPANLVVIRSSATISDDSAQSTSERSSPAIVPIAARPLPGRPRLGALRGDLPEARWGSPSPAAPCASCMVLGGPG